MRVWRGTLKGSATAVFVRNKARALRTWLCLSVRQCGRAGALSGRKAA